MIGPSLNDPKGEREKEHCLCPSTQAEGVGALSLPAQAQSSPQLQELLSSWVLTSDCL